MPRKYRLPEGYLKVPDLLSEVERVSGIKVSDRCFRWWQSERLLPPPQILPGWGHIGWYPQSVVWQVVRVARARLPLRKLRAMDKRPALENLALMDHGIPTVLEVVGTQPLPDGRLAKVLRDGSLLIPPRTHEATPPED